MEKRACRLKDEGNSFYKGGKYPEAIKAYSDSISLLTDCLEGKGKHRQTEKSNNTTTNNNNNVMDEDDDSEEEADSDDEVEDVGAGEEDLKALSSALAAVYNNRAAAHLMAGHAENTLTDCRASLNADSSFTKARLRAVKALLALGRPAEALTECEVAADRERGGSGGLSCVIEREEAEVKTVLCNLELAGKLLSARKFSEARLVTVRLEKNMGKSSLFKSLLARCLIGVGELTAAQQLISQLVRDGTNVDVYYLRAELVFRQRGWDAMAQACELLKHALQCDPEHALSRPLLKSLRRLEAAKKEGNEQFASGHAEEAVKAYTVALELCESEGAKHLCGVLFSNRAAAQMKQKKFTLGLADCQRALDLDQNNTKAKMRRAQCYMETEMYDDAVRDYDALFKADRRNADLQECLKRAKLALKKSKQKDYYKGTPFFLSSSTFLQHCPRDFSFSPGLIFPFLQHFFSFSPRTFFSFSPAVFSFSSPLVFRYCFH